jgi:HEAT repeat protein
MKVFFSLCIIFLTLPGIYGQDANDDAAVNTIEASRLATIQYGTETEIAALIQALKNENADYLDNELMELVQNTRNRNILSGVFSFFGDRNKGGLEDRAIRAVEEWDEETGETVLSALDYLGKVKAGTALEPLKKLLETEDRRFVNAAIRAIGRAASGDEKNADDAALYLIDYYAGVDSGSDNQREIVSALGSSLSKEAVPFLAELAQNNEERPVLRMAALDALGKIGDDKGRAAVVAAVSDKDPNVRSSAVAALAPFTGEDVDTAILEAFRDSYYRTRLAAAKAARDRRMAGAVPYLKYRAERDDVPNVKDESLRALGAIGGADVIKILDGFFSEKKNSDRVRILAAEMLVTNESDAYIDKVIRELDDAKAKNQTALYNGFLKVIGEAKSPRLEAITRRFFTAGGAIEKSYAMDMAANNDFKNMSEELKKLKEDKNSGLSRKAARTLEKLGIE